VVGADRKHLGLGTAALRGPPIPAVARGEVLAQRTCIDLVSDDINPNVRKFLSELSFADITIEGPLLALSHRLLHCTCPFLGKAIWLPHHVCQLPKAQVEGAVAGNGSADWTLVLI